MDKILVVDDHEQNCEILEDVLIAWGYKVSKAFHGMEALQLAIKDKPDIILLDVMLPGMNGFEVCKKLKNNNNTRNIPIIMLSVLNDVEDRIRGFNVGADIFLSKPISYNELKNRIISLINNKKLLDKMEHQDQVVESYLEFMKIKDYKLYLHSIRVKDYCEKVAKLLSVADQNLEHLLIGAYLHDIGKLVSDHSIKEHVLIGEKIVKPFNISKWIISYIRNHHEKLNGKGYPDGLMGYQMKLELQILITVNRFIEIWEQLDSKENALEALKNETKMGYWGINVFDALKQVLEDEKFIAGINLR